MVEAFQEMFKHHGNPHPKQRLALIGLPIATKVRRPPNCVAKPCEAARRPKSAPDQRIAVLFVICALCLRETLPYDN
jgi:hypothetical protein